MIDTFATDALMVVTIALAAPLAGYLVLCGYYAYVVYRGNRHE